MHIRQLSQVILESPGYSTDLLLSHMGPQISCIKWSFELFCALIWNLAYFFLKIPIFFNSLYGFWDICTYLDTDKYYFIIIIMKANFESTYFM